MDALWQDIRYALRTLARSPGFTAIGIFVLALAIAVNTAIFSIVNALIFRSMAVDDPATLRFVVVTREFRDRPGKPESGLGLSYRAFLDLRSSHPLFADAFGYAVDIARIRNERELQLFRGERVTANYFGALRVRAATGRLFVEGDESPAVERVVVISHDLWRSRFGSDPHVVGRTLELEVARYADYSAQSQLYTIIGVVPASFQGMYRFQPTEFWVLHVQRALDPEPDPVRAAARMADPVGDGGLAVALRTGNQEQAAEMRSLLGGVARHIHTTHDASLSALSLDLETIRPNRVPFDRTGRIVPTRLAAALLLVAGVVALIGIANLTGLLAARGIARRMEFAIRLTLGAGTRRVFRQGFIEALLVASTAAAVAVVVTTWLLNIGISLLPEASTSTRGASVPVIAAIPIDWRVWTYVASATLLSTISMAAVPLRQAQRLDLVDGLREGGATSGSAVMPGLRRAILVPQIASCLMLVVVTGVITRTLIREELRSAGYEDDGVVLIEYARPFRPYPAYPYPPKELGAYGAEKRVRSERVIRQIALYTTAHIALMEQQSFGVPLPFSNSTFAARDGFSVSPRHTWVKTMWTTESYFDVLQIPIVAGRGFSSRDAANSEPVAVISQHLARLLWPGQPAIGQYLGMHTPGSPRTPDWRRVVGVARDINLPLSEGNPSSVVYELLTQRSGADSTLLARHDGKPAALIEEMKALLMRADPEIRVTGARIMSDAVDAIVFPRRMTAAVLALSALCGVVLACIGLYGIVSYTVAQRGREIGIRTTLGAERRDIMRLFLRDGIALTAIGTSSGLILGYAAVKVVSHRLVALPELGVAPFAAAPVIVFAAMLLATYIPARRAASVDPMVALRRL